MAGIDNRLNDAVCFKNIEENFNRVLALIDEIAGDEGALAALEARIEALEEAAETDPEAEPAGS